MEGNNGYAVFFYPQALEALGEAIKPYLQEGPAGPHVACKGIDTGGALIEMTLDARTGDGRQVALELMVPSGMVRMIVSAHSDGLFGFGPRVPPAEPEIPAASQDTAATGAPAAAPPAQGAA